MSLLRLSLSTILLWTTTAWLACDGGLVEQDNACEDVECSGHGLCGLFDNQPICICDSGYHSDGLACIEDVEEDDDVEEEEEVEEEDDLGTLIFSNGFESGDLEDWRCSGNCPSVVNSPVFDGSYAGNFVLTRDLPTSYRTEVVVNEGLQFAFGQEYCITMVYRYEDWAVDSDAECGPFQIHTTPSSWDDPDCGTGSAYSTAPFLMFAQNDLAKFITYGGNILWEGPLEKQQWLTIKVHFRISTGSDGFIEFWKDGVKLGRVEGRNNAGVDGCGEPQREPYFKMGVYKWNWKVERPATDTTRRQLYIDKVKVYQK